MKKWFAGVSAVAISLTQVSAVLAAYSDVSRGVWYEEAVNAFVDAGYLDASQARFRGGDPANRAEFVKLVVELNGGVLSTPPAVASFDDARPGTWYYNYFEEAGKEGWVRGDKDCYGSHPCYARPSANINRAEAAALIVRAFGLDGTGDAPRFVDNPTGQWYTDVIQAAADHCVLQGDSGTTRVRPGDNMNRAEMVVMLYRVDQGMTYGVDCGTDGGMPAEAQLTDVVATAADTVEAEFNVSLDEDAAEDATRYTVTGDEGELDIDSVSLIGDSTVEITLADTMSADGDYTLAVEDMMGADGDVFSDSMPFGGFNPLPKGDGILEVSAAASNPLGDTVPKGAVGVVMMSLDLTASCDDDVSLTDITVLHEGFGDETDIDGVYASIDGGRASRKRSIDSQDQTADLRFSTPLTIAKCQTKTVDIVADYASTASTAAEHNLAVELPSDFRGNAKEVDGNFPMRGNTFRVASVTSGRITVEYRTVSPDEVQVGDENVVLGKFELSTNSVEDQTVYSMTFEQNGSASDADLANIAIRRTDGTVLTNKAQTVGDFVTLVFDPPFTILQGDNLTFEVTGDILGGATDTVIMHFEERSDIFAVGSLFGYGVNGQLYGSQVNLPTETALLPDTIHIDAGEFTIEIDGPVQQKFTRDDNDAVLANILMSTGGETVDIKDLFIAIQAQTGTGQGLAITGNTASDNVHEVLEDVELRNTKTGQTISAVRLTGTSEFGAGTSSTSTFQIYRFDDFTVNGQETWEFRVDFIDNGSAVGAHPRSGDQFRIHICGDATSNTTASCTFGGLLGTATTAYNIRIEGLSTGDDVVDVRPGGTISGNFHRVADAELTVAVKAIGTTDTAVKNAKNVQLLRFEARAGEAEDVLLTKAIFQAQSGSLLNGQNYTLWADTDQDTVVDTIIESGVASQSNTVTFDDLAGGGYVIPAEETVLFEVRANISASLTGNDLMLRFATGSSVTFLEAEQVDDGSSLSGLSLNGTLLNGASSADIIVSTTNSKNWVLANQGDLFVIKDTTPTRSRQLLGGALGEAVLRLQLRAENEPIDVTDFQFTSSGSTASSVDRLELYKEGEVTAFAQATIGGCGSDDVLTTNPDSGFASVQTFCANMESRQLVVPEGETMDILVRPRIKADVEGGTTNQLIQFFLYDSENAAGVASSDNNTGSGAIRARGSDSSNNLSGNDGDSIAEGEVFIGTETVASNNNIVGNINLVVMAKITSITNANPDPDNTNIPTGISPFGQFKFTAATNNNSLSGLNKAVISGVIFNVNATNVDLDGSLFKMYNKADASTKATCTILGSQSTSGSLSVQCAGLPSTSVNTEMNSGESLTVVLEGSITNPKTSGSATSTLQASIQDFTTLSTNTFGVSASHISWLDKDTSQKQFYWIEYPETVVKSTSYKS